MQNFDTVALYTFVAFYIAYVVIALAIFFRKFRPVASAKKASTKESGWVNFTPGGLIVLAIVVASTYVMGRWIFQQATTGCMTVAWWNPTCYNMNAFNRSWFAVFVVISINALMFTLILDTKQQNKRLRR